MRTCLLAYSNRAVPDKERNRFVVKLLELREYLASRFDRVVTLEESCGGRCWTPCDQIVVFGEHPYHGLRYEFVDMVNATTGKSEKASENEVDRVPVALLLKRGIDYSGMCIGVHRIESVSTLKYIHLELSLLRSEFDSYFK